MQQPKINLRDHGTQIKCEKCGSETFKEVIYLFKVSRLITQEAQDSMVPVPTFACSECGNVNREFSLNPPAQEVGPASIISGE